jgi:hypothetical protein
MTAFTPKTFIEVEFVRAQNVSPGYAAHLVD